MKKATLTEDKAEKTPTGGVLVGKREGQTIIHNKGTLSGYLVGKTHAEGGIKAVNKSTGQPLEMQGGEVVITAPAVSDQTKREFEGKMMTNREILSAINEKGGGVAFAKGGDIPKKIKRTGASYKYGGKTMTDHEIYKYITGGGIAEDFSIRDIANIHQVPLSELKEEVRIGMIAESEHKADKKDQMEIVKDHLLENPKYYTLLKKAGLVEEKTAPLEKSKWLKQFYVTNNPSIDKLLKDLQPKIKELIEKQKELVIKESTRIFGEPRPMSELDIEFYEAGLLLKMVQSFNKYLKNSDELYDVTINKSGGLFEVNGKVKREGRTYRFDTELIGAGGYNIQEYHYRYIIKTDLPSSNENSAVENIKAKMGILRKIKTVDEDIARYEKSISSYEKQIKDGGYQLKSGEFYKLSERYVESYKSSILDYRKEIQKFENKKSDLISVFESLDKKGVGVNFGKQVKEAIGRRILVDRLHGSKYKETGDTLDFKIDSRSIKGKELGNREFESLGTINTFSFVDEGNGLCTMKAGLELRGKYTPYAEYKNLPIKEIPYKINEIFNGEFSRYLEYENGGEVEKALNDLQKAPSVSFWYEPEFNGETYFFEKEGEPNSFVSLQEDDISKTILAYDEDGKLVGAFKIRTWGDLKGAFKIVVREDAKNKGWGKKLLDEAEKQNIDIVNNVKNNSFSSSGRDLLRSWLNKKSKQYKNGGLESGGKILNQNSKNRVLSDKYKNKMATSTAKKDIRTFYNKVNDFDDRKDSEHWRKYALPYDTKFDIEFKKGGEVHKESLVRDAKSGNTPARDLNNYNDVLDIDADGMVGAETSLYADGGLIAPNGNKSNLTPEQYKLVRTPEFKAWFGDWENDPENASKVVDENGEPLVVYHGTDKEFNVFDKTKSGELETIEGVDRKIGIYFTNKKSVASFFTKNKGKISNYFVVIKNPFKTKIRELSTFNIKFNRELGSDGVIWNRGSGVYINGKEYPLQKGEIAEIEYIVFEPNQIKLADGTNTNFDSSNPDIRYELGGIFHGSPYNFDKFTTSKMGSGIGQQEDGWGIYLTDKKEATKNYGKYIYETTLFKNKSLGEYNFIDLKKPVKKDIVTKILKAVYKKYNKDFDIIKFNQYYDYNKDKSLPKVDFNDYDLVEFDYAGYLFYKTLSRILGGDKNASLFLLDNGIDGLKRSLENSKGVFRTDYVIFDENAITIENKEYLPNNYYADGGKVGVETILFAVRKGEPDWNEVLITNNPDKIEDAKKWALANGFDRLRVSKIDMMEKPDFKKTFADGGKVDKARYRIIDSNGRVKYTGGTEMGSWFTLEKAKELVNYSNGEMIYEYDNNGDRLYEVFATGGMFNTEPFLNYYFDEIAEFLKYQNNITLNKDFTFKYKGELFRVEPIVLSEKNIKEAYFSIIDSDNEEVGDIVFNPNNNKKFEANSDFFDWNNIKFYDGGNVKPYDANMEGDSADMIFAEGGAVSSVVDNWDKVPSIWKNTSKVKKVAFTNSPYDKGLYSIVAPFLGKDELRPIMSGINFDENGITVTNAHVLITLPYPSKEFEGVYEADLSKRASSDQITIDGNYPNYSAIIPKKEVTKPFFIDVYKLLQYTNVALKFANKYTFAVNYKIEDEIIGFNGKFLVENLKTLLKLGHDKAYAHFIAPNKAVLLSPNEDYEIGNDELILTMPVLVRNATYGAIDIDYGRGLKVYYDFNDNEIHNADGSIAEFKMTYENNSIISKEDVTLLEKLANGKNRLAILDYVLIENGIARASDLDSEYYLSGVDLPNGVYKTNKGALEITMEATEDYPRSPIFVADENTIQFVISSDILEYYIDKFQNVVGKDDLRPVLKGICLHHTSDNKLFLAGTDANILLKVNITEYVDMPVYNKDMKFIIQPKRLYDFLNSTENTALKIKSNVVATIIESDNWSFYARNIDGNYPNYDAVMPKETNKLAVVNLEPIKKAFTGEMVKNYIKEADKSQDVFIFNNEDEIFIGTSGKRYASNPYYVTKVEKICDTNVDFSVKDYYNNGQSILLLMPYGYDKQTNFSFRKDLVDRVLKIVNDNKLELHYTEMNRAYLIPIDTFDFKATTKEHKVREQKPSVAEVKLVSTINEVNEIKEAIETLEMLSETATRKDKKEIKEAIEVLQMLLDTYEY